MPNQDQQTQSHITDIIMIIAVVVGPCFAVWLSEWSRKRSERRERKERIFRILYSTRSACHVVAHIDALNLVEIEFYAPKRKGRKVIEAWRLYWRHLSISRPTDPLSAEARVVERERVELLANLLYEMGQSLDIDFQKSDILSGAYYPQLYEWIEQENRVLRASALEFLQGDRVVRVAVRPDEPSQPPPPSPPPPDQPTT